MKIIILHPHFIYPRGATRLVLETTERLAQRGYDCLIITIGADKTITKDYPHVTFLFLGGPITSSLSYWFTYPLFQIKLHRLLNKIPNKILFPHVMPSNHWAFIYKKFHPEAPVIWFCHEPSAFIHSPAVIDSLGEPAETALRIAKPILSLLDKWLVKSADFIIANSQFTASQVKRVYGRIVDAVAYPAVNYNKFRSLNSKGNYIFTVNRLDKAKNIDVLIRAFAKLPSRFQEKFSVIIGEEGRERKSLERLAKNLHVLAKVKFLGEILDEDLPRWYARARLVVFASVDEPFGIIPLEAMASGTPVLATNTGGVKETVIDGITGCFVKPEDACSLANKIQELLEDEKKLWQLSKNCRDYIQKKFSWDKTVTVIEKLLVKAEAKIAKPTGRR